MNTIHNLDLVTPCCLQLGAFVNETFQAREGFSPDLFPEQVPVYMGHYHKPHKVQNTNIEYIGSPYQGKLKCGLRLAHSVKGCIAIQIWDCKAPMKLSEYAVNAYLSGCLL